MNSAAPEHMMKMEVDDWLNDYSAVVDVGVGDKGFPEELVLAQPDKSVGLEVLKMSHWHDDQGM